MRLLLDTHLLLWSGLLDNDPENRLSEAAADLIDDEANTLYFSVVSVWEVVIKSAQPRRRLDVDPRAFRRGLLASGYDEVSITGEHALAVARLPDLHGDPFDRLLLAQAVVEDLLLVTSNERLASYPGPVRRV